MENYPEALLVTPAGSESFNTDGALFTLKLDGFEGPELRVTIDIKARQTGAVVHSIYGAAITGMCEGWCLLTDPAARNAAEAALQAKVQSIWSVDGTFTVTESGLAAKSLTVRNNVEFRTAIVQGTLHSVTFGLVAADPVWT